MIPEPLKRDIANAGYAKLFGSRSMAVRPSSATFDPTWSIGRRITPTTDWDFSQQHSEEVHNYLVSAGYTHHDNADYFDDLTVGVYAKSIDGYSAHFVLHNNEELFRRVWDSISAEFYHKFLWKRSDLYAFEQPLIIKKRIKQIMNQLYETGAD